MLDNRVDPTDPKARLMTTCTCPYLKVGGRPTESRNWNPDCAEHGLQSEWFQSDEQKRKREAQSIVLRGLQAQARAARNAR
jgi:hypothetical protein